MRICLSTAYIYTGTHSFGPQILPACSGLKQSDLVLPKCCQSYGERCRPRRSCLRNLANANTNINQTSLSLLFTFVSACMKDLPFFLILLVGDENTKIPHVLAVCIMHWPSQSGFLLFAPGTNFVSQGAERSCFKKKMLAHTAFPEYSRS